jgi:hypothetical protein
VNYYFHRFLGTNPFEFTALDIKALYMGATGSSWRHTRSSNFAKLLSPKLKGDHDTLQQCGVSTGVCELAVGKWKGCDSDRPGTKLPTSICSNEPPESGPP